MVTTNGDGASGSFIRKQVSLEVDDLTNWGLFLRKLVASSYGVGVGEERERREGRAVSYATNF